jgi:pilus assembly protein CpaF
MEALASNGGLTRAALHSQLAAAVQVVLHMRRLSTGRRVLDALGVLTAADGGVAVRSVWVRGLGLTRDRDLLAGLLAQRGTAVPW